jgi:hypothetical protein
MSDVLDSEPCRADPDCEIRIKKAACNDKYHLISPRTRWGATKRGEPLARGLQAEAGRVPEGHRSRTTYTARCAQVT